MLPVDILAGFEEINYEICDLFGTKAQLYGSAVNGFSVPGSDVDAAVILPKGTIDELRLAVEQEMREETQKKEPGNKESENEEELLVVPEKAVEVAAIRLVASRIEHKFPGVYKIEKIESARVPILIVKRFLPDDSVV
jgi:predicted nucleotidyltransferase